MHIALATCRDLPEHEVDDEPLRAALRSRGARVEDAEWDDTTIDWTAFDAVLIRTTWDYQERRDAFVRWAENVARRTRLFNPAPLVRWNTDKRYLREIEARGVAIAPTVWLERRAPVDVARIAGERGWTRGFVKPVVGATARETLRFDRSAEGLAAAQDHLERTLAREAMMLQPYLESVESEGEISAVFVDGVLTHAVRKVPVEGDYRVQDDFGASDEPVELTAEEAAEARRTLAIVEREASWRGEESDDPLLYARVDYLRGDDGRLLLIELEAVEPSMFFRHGADAADRLAAALLARVSDGAAHG